MPKIALYKSFLESARDRASLSEEELEKVQALIWALPAGSPRIELADYPMALVRAILEESKLRPAQRAAIALYIYGVTEEDLDHTRLYQMKVQSPVDFGSALSVDVDANAGTGVAYNRIVDANNQHYVTEVHGIGYSMGGAICDLLNHVAAIPDTPC